MAKYHPTFEHGNFYHVYNRGNSYADIFVEERNYDLFLSMTKKYLLQVADIYAYCLMKNHFHLLLKIKDTHEIEDEKLRLKPSLAFAYMFNAYAKTFNKTYNRRGSLFQEHLKKEIITNDDYLRRAVRYIHLNPVKHQFSDSIDDYPHSSYNAFLSDKRTLLKRDNVLQFFGGVDNFKLCHHLEEEDLIQT